MATEAIQKMIQMAYDAGIPRDQLENFLRYKYIPLPWQLKFHAEARECDKPDKAVKLGVGGARGPGKSHCVFAQMTLDDCQRVVQLKGLFLRQTGRAAQESFNDLILKVISGNIDYDYNSSHGILTFKNKSRVILGGFRDERDIDNYIGIEYDFIAIEEINQLTKNKVDKLLGSMRTSKPEWRPRLYTSFNPGGVGHVFVKKTFVIPYQDGNETETRFVPSTYKDNPYLNKEYIDYLEGLEGSLGKAWREGNFDIFEGQFFGEWDRNQHVVAPFKIPDTWLRFRSIDPSGRSGITSCHWYAVDTDKNVFIYREHYATGMDADEHARRIVELSGDEDYRYTIIDSSAFSKIGLPQSIADVYISNGIGNLIKSSKDRIAGWNIVHQYLRWDKWTPPKLKIFSTCPDIIRTIPEMIHDEKRPEDLDCYVKGTLISTPNGDKKVENIKIGDEVITPVGDKRVIKAGISGVSDLVIDVFLSNGKKLRGTANHKIYVIGKGLVELQKLQCFDILGLKTNTNIKTLWKIRQLFIKGLNILKEKTESILSQVAHIYQRVIHHFIARFILITLVKFQRDTIFIIKTIIGIIIPQKIWLQCPVINTHYITIILQRQKQKQIDINGRSQKQERKYYKKMQRKCEKILQQEDLSADIVELLLKLNILCRFIAISVKNLEDFIKLFVPSVVKNFLGKKMVKEPHKLVHITAVGNYGREKVYRLTVEDAHLYYANGILSTNTNLEDHAVDELRYLLQTLRDTKAVKEETMIQKRLREIKEKDEGYSFRYVK